MMSLPVQTANSANDFWSQALTNSTSLQGAVILLLCIAGLLIGGWVLMNLHSGNRRRTVARPVPARRDSCRLFALFANDTHGTATLEFTLVFPMLLFLGLLLIQTTLLMAGNLYVHAAAFAATRSAVVMIPADNTLGGEPPNTIIHSAGHGKYDAIRRAAVYALVPVSGQLKSGASTSSEAFTMGLSDFHAASGRDNPAWINNLAANRLRYAAEPVNTVITIKQTQVSSNQVAFSDLSPSAIYMFGPKDPITVEVSHRLNLSIPLVRAVYGDGRHEQTGTAGMYTQVTAQYTLTNHGISKDLPPRPAVEREEPRNGPF